MWKQMNVMIVNKMNTTLRERKKKTVFMILLQIRDLIVCDVRTPGDDVKLNLYRCIFLKLRWNIQFIITKVYLKQVRTIATEKNRLEITEYIFVLVMYKFCLGRPSECLGCVQIKIGAFNKNTKNSITQHTLLLCIITCIILLGF